MIERAARMVDTLVVGVGVHPGKTPLFAVAEKIELLKAETAPIAKATGCKIEIVTFDNLTVASRRRGRRQPHLSRPARWHRLRL